MDFLGLTSIGRGSSRWLGNVDVGVGVDVGVQQTTACDDVYWSAS